MLRFAQKAMAIRSYLPSLTHHPTTLAHRVTSPMHRPDTQRPLTGNMEFPVEAGNNSTETTDTACKPNAKTDIPDSQSFV